MILYTHTYVHTCLCRMYPGWCGVRGAVMEVGTLLSTVGISSLRPWNVRLTTYLRRAGSWATD